MTFAANTFTIFSSTDGNGVISPAGSTSVNCGNSQGYTITPATGYAILDVKVDNVSVGAVSSYQFGDLSSDHTIYATFVLNNYTITASSAPNGTVTPTGVTNVPFNSSASYTITADPCYHIVDVLVDNISVGTTGSYTFTNVTGTHTISATFAANTAAPTGSAGRASAMVQLYQVLLQRERILNGILLRPTVLLY